MDINQLKLKLEERLIRLNSFKDTNPEIIEHGVPEIDWVLKAVKEIQNA